MSLEPKRGARALSPFFRPGPQQPQQTGAAAAAAAAAAVGIMARGCGTSARQPQFHTGAGAVPGVAHRVGEGPEEVERRAGTHRVLELLPLEGGEHLHANIASATPHQARLPPLSPHAARAASCTARSNKRRARPRRHAHAHSGGARPAAAHHAGGATCTPARESVPRERA